MRSSCISALALWVLISNFAQAQQAVDAVPESIQWAEDLETAQRLSQESGRPVIAYFTFEGCVWCDRLKEACFSDPEVVSLSRSFVWVTVDRDKTPEIPKRLNVSAYPSLLTLGRDEENVFRFQSYQEPPEFLGNLRTALRRYNLYQQGQEWMQSPTRPERITEAGSVAALDAPADGVPGGITVLDGATWVVQGQGELYKLETDTGRLLQRFKVPESIGDLCNDGALIYAMTFGWTAGAPIYVIDPANGTVVREIVTEVNRENRSHGAKGIAWRDGRLYVLSGMVGKVFEISVDSGEMGDEIQLAGTWLSGLDFYRGRLMAGSATALREFDPQTGAVVSEVACHYPLRSVAAAGDRILLMEQPIFGFGRHHERIQIWPQKTQIHILQGL